MMGTYTNDTVYTAVWQIINLQVRLLAGTQLPQRMHELTWVPLPDRQAVSEMGSIWDTGYALLGIRKD